MITQTKQQQQQQIQMDSNRTNIKVQKIDYCMLHDRLHLSYRMKWKWQYDMKITLQWNGISQLIVWWMSEMVKSKKCSGKGADLLHSPLMWLLFIIHYYMSSSQSTWLHSRLTNRADKFWKRKQKYWFVLLQFVLEIRTECTDSCLSFGFSIWPQ